jgi:hypothetical protein
VPPCLITGVARCHGKRTRIFPEYFLLQRQAESAQ